MLRSGHCLFIPTANLTCRWWWPPAGWNKLTYCQVGRWHWLHCRHSFDTAHIGQAMLIIIPPTIRQVDATHKCHGLVNDDELLVVGPEVHGGGHMVWVSHHLGREAALKLSIIAQFTSLQPESCPAVFFGCSGWWGNTGVFRRCLHTDCCNYWSYMTPPESGLALLAVRCFPMMQVFPSSDGYWCWDRSHLQQLCW